MNQHRSKTHGGQLLAASKKYKIPLADWIDLSTGINPNSWPVPDIPKTCWQRLPDEDDLLRAAQNYYQCDSLLLLPGSQAGIQSLPQLRPACRVLVRENSYSEHALHWHYQGHQVNSVTAQQFEEQIDHHDVVIVINPDNPSGDLIPTKTLVTWQQSLAQRGGWLIIDEAFIDVTPDHSLSPQMPLPGLFILRSMGKFFGLAGIRAGALLGDQQVLQPLAKLLGPWPISHPTRWIATRALLDTEWQKHTRKSLHLHSQNLQRVLSKLQSHSHSKTDLFQTLLLPNAASLYERFSKVGILTRLLDNHSGLRFGLPGSSYDLQRLEAAIVKISDNETKINS